MATPRQTILILNGPNLNMLGVREPDIYGFKSLSQIALDCEEHASTLGFSIDFRQSNSEGEMISILHEARETSAGVILNAGAYTHTSIALLDAAKILECPLIEVHLSNLWKRESFRHHSYISTVAAGVIAGFGGYGYILALDALRAQLDGNN
jgi:3-dehydroquinate dehydratase-2